MKKNYIVIAVATVLLGAASCRKQAGADPGLAALSLSWDASVTKGAATPAEKQVNALVFYVFDEDGSLDVAHCCSGTEIAAGKAVLLLKTGAKRIRAVANLGGAPLERANACKTIEELEAVTLELADNAIDRFVMTAAGQVDVLSSETPVCQLRLTRPLAKVVLASVTNRLPLPHGSIRLRRAFLCNVVGERLLGGEVESPAWINPEGTPDGGGKEHTIGQGGYAARVPDLTFRSLDDTVAPGGGCTWPDAGIRLYAFPNARTEANDGYTDPFSPTATVLMLVVEIGGVDYYYPVALERGLAANTENFVHITLSGLGNTLEEGPFNKIEKKEMAVEIRVEDWAKGGSYTERI